MHETKTTDPPDPKFLDIRNRPFARRPPSGGTSGPRIKKGWLFRSRASPEKRCFVTFRYSFTAPDGIEHIAHSRAEARLKLAALQEKFPNSPIKIRADAVEFEGVKS